MKTTTVTRTTCVLMISFLLAPSPLVAATNAPCYNNATIHYQNARGLCHHNAERINCHDYCLHLQHNPVPKLPGYMGLIRHEFATQAETDAWVECIQKYEIPCLVNRDFALNQCLEITERRLQDEWSQCAGNPHEPHPANTTTPGWTPTVLPPPVRPDPE